MSKFHIVGNHISWPLYRYNIQMNQDTLRQTFPFQKYKKNALICIHVSLSVSATILNISNFSNIIKYLNVFYSYFML